MPSLIVRNLPKTTRPGDMSKLGSLLAKIGAEIGGVELDIVRNEENNEPLSFT